MSFAFFAKISFFFLSFYVEASRNLLVTLGKTAIGTERVLTTSSRRAIVRVQQRLKQKLALTPSSTNLRKGDIARINKGQTNIFIQTTWMVHRK